jgi:hypothetical protein
MKSIWMERVVRGRGAFVVWCLLALALVLPACAERASNSDGDIPDVVTETGVQLFNLQRDDTRRTVAATVVDNGQSRRLTLAPLSDGPSPGFVARMAAGEAYFELSVAINEVTGETWIRERTAVDEMTMTIREAGGRMYETYNINGAWLALDRPAVTQGQMEKAVHRYRNGDIESAAMPEMQELGTALAAFDAFYSPTATNTLHNNANGEFLVSLLFDPALAGAVTGQEVAPGRIEGLSQRFCWGVTRCAAFKCAFGGFENPVCLACFSAVVACVVMEIYCWFADCSCCY